MDDIRLWAILGVSLATLLYTAIGNYAIRGNELKHIKEDINEIKKNCKCNVDKIFGRINDLYDKLFEKGD